MFRMFPDLSEDLLLRLYHKGAHAVWTSEDIDWEAPMELTEAEGTALAHVLSPVYLGEQSAMLGAANVLPQLAAAGESTAQLYLTTFLIDEARHFETLTTLYRRLGEEPVGIRRLPAMLRYHHRLRQGDRVDWVWGILISDLFAKQFYQLFAKARPEALFGRMSQKILVDESRHQAFCDHYLTRVIPTLSPERLQALRQMRDELLKIMDDMNSGLHEDADTLGFSGVEMLERLHADLAQHSRRIGLDGSPPDGGGRGSKDRPPVDLESRRRTRPEHPHGRIVQAAPKVESPSACGSECDACPLMALCQSRIVRRAAR